MTVVAAPPGRLAAWAPSLRVALLVFVPVRLGLWLLGLLGVGLLPSNTPVDVPGWPAPTPAAPWHAVFTSWERQDALWFLRIADAGYGTDDGSAAFFPLYPLLVRAASALLGGSPLPAAYLVSSAALVAGLAVVHRLTLLELGSDLLARRTVLYLAVFPTAIFLFAPYSESLFLALTAGCLYAARRSAWLPAAALGALASGTRSAGVLLVLPLAVEALLQHRGVLRETAGRLLAAASAALGTGAYLLWWQLRHGDGLRPLEVQRESWQREPALPWQTLVDGVQEGTRHLGSYAGGYHALDLLLVGVALAAGVWAVRRLRATWAVWLWASLVLPLTLQFAGRPLLSMPRYLVVLPPLFWALARFGERWRAHDAVVVVSASGLGVFGLLFVSWYYVF